MKFKVTYFYKENDYDSMRKVKASVVESTGWTNVTYDIGNQLCVMETDIIKIELYLEATVVAE